MSNDDNLSSIFGSGPRVRVTRADEPETDEGFATQDGQPDGIEGTLVVREFKPLTVNESTHPDVKKAIVNIDDSTVTFYLPDGWLVNYIDQSVLNEGVNNGQTVFRLADVAGIEVDSSKQRTCRYFTAHDGHFAEGGVEAADDFAFYRPGTRNNCSQPDRVGLNKSANVECDCPAAQVNCNVYEAQEWSPVTIVKGRYNDGTEEIAALEKTRLGYGRPVYRTVVGDVPGDQVDSPEQFLERVAEYADTEEIPFGEPVIKDSFLEFVMAE